MNLFGSDKCLKEENCRLTRELECVRRERDDLRSRVDDNAIRELKFLREAIKPYVEYSSKHIDYYCDRWTIRDGDPLESPKYFHATKTLKTAEREILDQKLYIAVMEGELGPEKTESAKNKLNALKALRSDLK